MVTSDLGRKQEGYFPVGPHSQWEVMVGNWGGIGIKRLEQRNEGFWTCLFENSEDLLTLVRLVQFACARWQQWGERTMAWGKWRGSPGPLCELPGTI